MRCAAIAGLLGLPVAASAQLQSDWERENADKLWVEDQVALPSFPRPEDLIEFDVSAGSEFRFYIDGATLQVGGDGVVRYVLVARSTNGVENVSFEGIRCATKEVRQYALGQPGGKWSARPGEWRQIRPRTIQRWHNALYGDYFCPRGHPVLGKEEAVAALRAGGHPDRRAGHRGF